MKKLIPLAVFLTVTLASVLAAGYAYLAVENASRIKFEAAADDAVGRIAVRIEQHISLLRATLAFFEANDGPVSRRAFRTFVETLELDDRTPGLLGIGFASYIPTGAEEAAEAFIAREFGQELEIWPQTDQDHRAAITLIAPFNERNQRALGYDMFSDETRRAAMIQAIEAGEGRASGRVQLVQEGDHGVQPGFLVYLPFHLSPGDAASTRPDGYQGFVYAPFRAGDLFNSALERAPLIPVAVEIYEGGVSPDRLLFRSQTPPASGKELTVQREMTVAGRRWVLNFQPTSAFTAPSSTAIPLAIGVFGLVLAAAFAFGARLQDRAYQAVTSLHDASQKSLVEKDLMLQEMKHRIKNSITRMLAIARQTAANSATVEEFSESFGARLQAMAASQDMLTRSRWQKADLGELLRIELEQVFGQNLQLDNLRGPRVELGEAATQALGLTFHELATNALKYGDVGTGDGSLVVEWRVEGKAPRRRLILTWTESSSALLEAPEKKGFGTRLIEANITRELGGTINRDYGEQALVIEISVPLP